MRTEESTPQVAELAKVDSAGTLGGFSVVAPPPEPLKTIGLHESFQKLTSSKQNPGKLTSGLGREIQMLHLLQSQSHCEWGTFLIDFKGIHPKNGTRIVFQFSLSGGGKVMDEVHQTCLQGYLAHKKPGL